MIGSILRNNMTDHPLTLPIWRAARRLLLLHKGDTEASEAFERALADGHLRILTVSRARYNPRFRGRLVTLDRDALTLLTHLALLHDDGEVDATAMCPNADREPALRVHQG